MLTILFIYFLFISLFLPKVKNNLFVHYGRSMLAVKGKKKKKNQHIE